MAQSRHLASAEKLARCSHRDPPRFTSRVANGCWASSGSEQAKKRGSPALQPRGEWADDPFFLLLGICRSAGRPGSRQPGLAGKRFKAGEGTGGGLMKNPMPGPPSTWLADVLVDDVRAATDKAASIGATALKGVTT